MNRYPTAHRTSLYVLPLSQKFYEHCLIHHKRSQDATLKTRSLLNVQIYTGNINTMHQEVNFYIQLLFLSQTQDKLVQIYQEKNQLKKKIMTNSIGENSGTQERTLDNFTHYYSAAATEKAKLPFVAKGL